jgi:hypothetical protein
MRTNLGPKKSEPFTRIIIQIILLILLSYFIIIIIHPSADFVFKGHYFAERPLRLWGTPIFLAVFNFMYFHQLLVLPFWVTIDDESNVITARFVFKPSIAFGINDIISYSNAIIKARMSSTDAIFIYLNNKKRIILSDLNLDDFRTVERFLISLKVKKSEEKQLSIFFI